MSLTLEWLFLNKLFCSLFQSSCCPTPITEPLLRIQVPVLQIENSLLAERYLVTARSQLVTLGWHSLVPNKVSKCLDFWASSSRFLDIDEYWARKGLIARICNRFPARLDAAISTVNSNQQACLCLLGNMHSQNSLIHWDLRKHFVLRCIFALRVVASAFTFFTHNCLSEIIVGTRVGIRTIKLQWLTGKLERIWFQLVTLPWAAGSQIFFSSPTLRQSTEFFGVDYNRETIKGNRQFNIFYVILLQSSISEELMGREACNVSFTRAELKTTTSPRHTVTRTSVYLWNSDISP